MRVSELSEDIMTQHRRTIRPLVGLLSAVVVGGGLLVAPADATTVPGGTVKGTVTIAGTPLAGAKVTLVRRDGDSGDAFERYKTVTTDSAGRYSLTRPAGSSTTWWYDNVVVSDPGQRAVTARREFMGNRSRTVTRNVTLKPAGTITGRITRADGASPASIRAEIVDGPDSSVIENLSTKRYDVDRGVDAAGTYRFRGLPAGTYTLCYRDTSSTYRQECHDEVFSETAATELTVTGGATTTVKAHVLDHRLAHVKGIVTSTSGERLRGISVRPRVVGTSRYAGSTRTWSTGRYDLATEAPNDVQLRFEDPKNIWATRWQTIAGSTQPQVFSLDEGALVERLTTTLKSTARLGVSSRPGTGRATFTVEVTRRATGHHPSGTITVSRKDVRRTVSLAKGVGTVTLTGVPAGTRTFHVDYAGTSSTAPARTTVKVAVR
ncbi:hypothetical protein GEV29_06995 [Aeromicrobium sp. SMF47]|uniref:hypothetical protein n=1 Tax=Aeromicrobium yanjiei TaxID=2662028 RepID=UPI00129DA64F|nr:hypothetical protein [Aeromicrobium yanjiei]MRJ76277.1 hypothetical protein [Aeromicrobium yanjiei]